MQKILIFILILLLTLSLASDTYSKIELDGYSMVITPSINIKEGEKLTVKIDQNGYIMVEIFHNGELLFNNTVQGAYRQGTYKDVNVTFEKPGGYVISMRNTYHAKVAVNYIIRVEGSSYSRSITLS